MSLSNDLLSEFAKIVTENSTQKPAETTVYGTIVEYNGSKYIKMDGSELLTPISSTTSIDDGDRVTAVVKNHSVVVTGNISSPSNTIKNDDGVNVPIGTKINEFENIVADSVSTKDLEATNANIEKLSTEYVVVRDTLVANDIIARNVETGELTASEATIKDLYAQKAEFDKLTAETAVVKDLTTDNLLVKEALIANKIFAEDIETGNLKASTAVIDALKATKLVAEDVETGKLTATDATLKFANIDFANIGEAAIRKFFSESGMIKDLVVGDHTVTGQFVGVTVDAASITTGELVADRIVVKGEDGIYYKLNVEAGAVASAEVSEEQLQNGLHGDAIIAKTITAEKVNVKDLVAFDATIGGFKITTNSLYSGTKSAATNTTRGIYLDNEGQMSIGDANNYLMYYKDTDGKYKLKISAASIVLGTSNKNIEEVVEELRDEITTNLRIESSRGTVFKNDSVSTVLSAVIYRGSQRITDITALRAAMGNGAYLQWKWQRLDDDTYGVILATDSRIGNDGFTLTISPSDVSTKVTFMCELIS